MELTSFNLAGVCRGCIDLTMYLQDPPQAKDIREAWNIYRSYCPSEQLGWIKTATEFFWDEHVDLKEEKALEPYLVDQDRRRDTGVMVRSGMIEGGWTFTIRGMFPKDLGAEECASFCRVVFPMDVEPEKVANMAGRFIDSLKILSGHAGYSVDYDVGRIGTAFEHIYTWARKYYGIDVVDLKNTLPCAVHEIKGAGWLTLLGNDFRRNLNVGVSALTERNSEITLTTGAHGVVIRCDNRPVLGDRNRCQFPHLYAEVERVLLPLKIKNHPSFPGRFQMEGVTKAWLRRFVEPENW